ncbi:MAG: MFS transporter, partial [Gammaproteobacteria bacterium]|nr:MFS transporter [Gammaproteobacteria bacterium]
MSPESTTRSSTAISLLPILSVNFVGTLGFSIVLPFLVFLVTKWGGNALIYGLLGATYSAFQLIGAPILGRWSDRYGRRKILLLSQLGTLLSWMIFLGAFLLPENAL